ncbi:hypothetical protein COV17_00405 [Candidatus Woesearchaeota archaeon CG10_big_fil_rev_8_21_14_0_10_36_11]|nr:MAG: hypothetical protein COV17_00405 [Candidatus Woesearchaeota archaeon CG10_big_fil_rev_8_21_14_0_10_36_11]
MVLDGFVLQGYSRTTDTEFDSEGEFKGTYQNKVPKIIARDGTDHFVEANNRMNKLESLLTPDVQRVREKPQSEQDLHIKSGEV